MVVCESGGGRGGGTLEYSSEWQINERKDAATSARYISVVSTYEQNWLLAGTSQKTTEDFKHKHTVIITYLHIYCKLDELQTYFWRTNFWRWRNVLFRLLKLMISNIVLTAAGSDSTVDAVLSSKSDRGIPSLIKTILLFPRRPLLRRADIINNALNKTTSQIVAPLCFLMNIGLCCVMKLNS